MTSPAPRSLGVLNLERGLPPGSPSPKPRFGAFLEFPLIAETVEGAWADRVIRGDSALEPAYIAAARRLVERGAVAITANCGFAIRHQQAVAASVRVPVALSSLLLLPGLLRQFPQSTKIAVVTADSTSLEKSLLLVDDPSDLARIVIGGIEGGELWRNEMKRPPPFTEDAAIERDVIDCVARMRKEDPEIAAFLFECSAFPMISASLRRSTKLPIYDLADLCRMTYASVG
ncbi:hypothetical protein [Bradyrhizobium sp. USDA 4504]